MTLQSRFWTPEKVTELIELADGTRSEREIAILLGATSNGMVSGKIHRLRKRGIPLLLSQPPGGPIGDANGTRKGAPKAAKPKGGRLTCHLPAPPRRKPASTIGQIQPEPPFEIFPDEIWLPIAASMPTRLEDAREGMCRWPLGEPSDADAFRFCGCPSLLDRPYCRDHSFLSIGRGSSAERNVAPFIPRRDAA